MAKSSKDAGHVGREEADVRHLTSESSFKLMGNLHDDLRTSFSSSAAPSPQVGAREAADGGVRDGGSDGGTLAALSSQKILSEAEVAKVRELMKNSR